MVKSFTQIEFMKYVRDLEFHDMESIIEFIRAYLIDVKQSPNDPDKLLKYANAVAILSPQLIEFYDEFKNLSQV